MELWGRGTRRRRAQLRTLGDARADVTCAQMDAIGISIVCSLLSRALHSAIAIGLPVTIGIPIDMMTTDFYGNDMAFTPIRSAYLGTRWAILKIITVCAGSVNTPDNGRFKIPRSLHPYTYWSLRHGTYEKAEAQILDEEFQPDDLIIDIGSNIGYISRRACSKLKPNGTIVCVEADPKNVQYLQSNMSDSRRLYDVHIVSAAIGAPEQEGQLVPFRQRRNLCSGLGDVAAPDKAEKVIQVALRSLSSIVESFDSAGKGYSLVCDAEGAEILILLHDREALRLCRQISVELHHPSQTGSDITADDMVQLLQDMGFVHKRVVDDTHYFCREGLDAAGPS